MQLPQLYNYPWMTADVTEFRQHVRRYLEGELAPHMDTWRRQGYIPREVWKGFGAMGFMLPEMPERFGGAGVSKAWQLVIQDELTRVEVPPLTGVHSIASHYILNHGTPEQQTRWLPKLIDGSYLAALAMTEPGCGSDLKAISLCSGSSLQAVFESVDWVTQKLTSQLFELLKYLAGNTALHHFVLFG
jgi:acyl-CoA dehydrogenase